MPFDVLIMYKQCVLTAVPTAVCVVFTLNRSFYKRHQYAQSPCCPTPNSNRIKHFLHNDISTPRVRAALTLTLTELNATNQCRANPLRLVHRVYVNHRVKQVMSSFFFFFLAHFYFPASGQAVVTGFIPSPPRFLPSIFIAHRVQQSHRSSIVHRVLLTHALALSASQFVHKKKSQ